MPYLHIRNSGTWQQVKQLYIKVNGVWTAVKNGYINVSGQNQQFWPPAIIPPNPTGYGITANTTLIGEGQTVNFTVTVQNFGNGNLYYQNLGTTTASDFADGANSGNIVIVNNQGSFTKTVLQDALVEGDETIVMALRTGNVNGTTVSTSQSVLVKDQSYAIAPNVTAVNEGSTVQWQVVTQFFGTGTLYYTNSGTTSAADFVDGVNSGSISIVNDSGVFSKTLAADAAAEGPETIAIQLRTGSTSGVIVANAAVVTVADTSLPAPTYAISPSTTAVNEGGTVTFTVTTQYFGTGTLYYTNSGTTGAADFVDGINSGSIAITNDIGVFSKTLTNDLLTEGPETIVMQVRSGSVSGTVQATAATVTVSDTSTTVVITYGITPSTTSVNEGGTVTYTVTTTNFGSGTLYYTNSGTTAAADFVDGVNSGSITITANSGTLTKQLVNDVTTEGTESIVIQLRIGSTSGAVVATASSVTVADTSQAPAVPTYGITPSAVSINEGSTVTYTVTTTNYGSGVLYYTNAGSTSAADFISGGVSGSITVLNATGTLSLTVANDFTTEGSESILLQLRTGSTSGTIVATASTVTVTDTSVYPTVPASFSYVGYSSQYDQDQVQLSINTQGVTTSTFYYTITPNNSTSFDTQSGNTPSGTFVVGRNSTATVNLRTPHDTTILTATVTGTGYTTYTQTLSVPARQSVPAGSVTLTSQYPSQWLVPSGVTKVRATLIGGGGGGGTGGIGTVSFSSVRTESQSFAYTGSPQSWTVPQGVTSITVVASGGGGGGGGGDSSGKGAAGKPGSIANGVFNVTPGDVIYIYVGGGGGAGGSAQRATGGGAGGGDSGSGARGGQGGAAGPTGSSGGGGGGGAASAVNIGGSLQLIAAGGGGGGGAGNDSSASSTSSGPSSVSSAGADALDKPSDGGGGGGGGGGATGGNAGAYRSGDSGAYSGATGTSQYPASSILSQNSSSGGSAGGAGAASGSKQALAGSPGYVVIKYDKQLITAQTLPNLGFKVTGGGGGGAGGYLQTTVPVIPGTQIAYVCGQGGPGGDPLASSSDTPRYDGSPGSETTFGGLRAYGGQGGQPGDAQGPGTPGIGGQGAIQDSGAQSPTGADGQVVQLPSAAVGGAGANQLPYGVGGNGIAGQPGGNATGYGSGGSGGGASATIQIFGLAADGFGGGNGAPGAVILEWGPSI